MTRATAEAGRREAVGRGAGLSLGTRIFLLMAALIGLSILLSVLVTAIGASRIARRAVLRALASGQTAQAAFQQQRREHLRIMARSLALDPYVTAYAAEAEGTVYASSILHLLEQRRRDFDFGFAIVLDPKGRMLARTDRPGAASEDLSSVPFVATALERGEASGIWQEGDGALYDVVAVPLARETSLFGYFVLGFPIDDEQARAVKRISGTDVVYLAMSSQGPSVAASTLDEGAQPKLLDALRRGGLAAGLQGAAGEDVSRPLELDLDGRRWIALVRPLQPGSGAAQQATMALAPLDAEMHAFYQIEKLLVAAGGVAMLLALGLSYALSRRALRPVQQLAVAAAAARGGNYDQRVQVRGDDEVAELARSFNTLLADLREKRDMEHYLADLSRSLPAAPPEPLAATAPGLVPSGSGDIGPSPTLESLFRPEGGTPGEAPSAPAAGSGREPGAGLAGLRPGTLLGGRYEILSALGSGGMGIVFKARDRDLDEIVALKILRPEVSNDREMLERLKSEVKLARKITHPNVVRTFDFLDLDGVPSISMEYVHGITLRALLDRSGKLPYSAGLHLARQLGAGLAAAHAQGVIHRDIKPENLVLQQNGTAKLMDFGIARHVRRTGPGKTHAGMVVGTPHYLAPEQLLDRAVDTRADIYASGVVLYEVFTGSLPFVGESTADILVQHLTEAPVSPRVHWPEIPAGLEGILLRCLEKSPENRFASVGELLDALENLREEPRLARKA